MCAQLRGDRCHPSHGLATLCAFRAVGVPRGAHAERGGRRDPHRGPLRFASPAAQAGPEEDKLAGDLLALVNKERVAAGCPELTVNPLLTDAARRHSQDLANHNGKSSHTGFDGSDPEARIRAAGYQPNGWAENVYANAPDASTAMYGQSGGYGWFNEPPDEKGKRGHHDNILTCIYTETGIGIARGSNGWVYWTQDFARPQPAAPTPDTSPDLVPGGNPDALLSTTVKVTESTATTFDCTTKARSLGDRTVPETITVRNRSGKVLTISFLDEKGAKTLPSQTGPGMKATIPSHVGSKWLVEDDTGACVVGLAGPGAVTIGPAG
jgi:uncharacterized protein YkwD